MKVYGVLVGKKPLIFTNNDSAYETALEFKKQGIDPIILDTREEQSSELIENAKKSKYRNKILSRGNKCKWI